jgi:hypothetical protein
LKERWPSGVRAEVGERGKSGRSGPQAVCVVAKFVHMHPYGACIFLKIHIYVEKYAKIRIKYGRNTQKWHRMSNIRGKSESKPLFIYAGEKVYAEGLLK